MVSLNLTQFVPLIDVTDKFLFDLKGEGLGLQRLCFDRQNRQGIVPKNIIPTHQHIKQENLDRNLKNLAQLLPLNKVEEVRLVYVANFLMQKSCWNRSLSY